MSWVLPESANAARPQKSSCLFPVALEIGGYAPFFQEGTWSPILSDSGSLFFLIAYFFMYVSQLILSNELWIAKEDLVSHLSSLPMFLMNKTTHKCSLWFILLIPRALLVFSPSPLNPAQAPIVTPPLFCGSTLGISHAALAGLTPPETSTPHSVFP